MKCSITTVVLAALLASPSAAQQAARTRQIDGATAGVLGAAIDALAREQYGEARRLVDTLDHNSLSAFERSRVEQLLFSAAYHERRYDEAREHLQRAIGAGGLTEQEVAQARYQRAQILMQQERWPEGVAALEAWHATAPQANASAYYLLAVAHYQSGDLAKALGAAREAIDRMEQPQESWLSLLSALHLQQEQFQDAATVLNRLIVVAPEKKTYWLQLSSVYGRLGDYGNALAIMQVAYNGGMLTESGEILRLADLLLFNEVPLRAAQVLDEAMEAGTIRPAETAYAKLGEAWLAAGDFDRAVAPLEQAAQLSLTGDRFVRLGEAQLEREDSAAAEAALSRAIAKGGLMDLGEAQFLMGVALYAQGRYAEARPWFEQSRAEPRHHDVSERYLRVIALEREPRRSL
jgi:tetratricopeptide (TPR) repeat protein